MIARDKSFYGFGPAKAAMLEAHFGKDLSDALAEGRPEVADVVGDELATVAFAAFAEKRAEIEFLDWLSRNGVVELVGYDLAAKISRCWGPEGIQSLAENPYLLASFLPWGKVQEVGLALGIAKEDPRRAVAAIEACLYERLDQCHTAICRDELSRRVEKLIGSDCANGAEALALAIEASAVVEFQELVQPLGAAAMEAFLARKITDLGTAVPVVDFATQQIEDQHLEEAINTYAASLSYVLTGRQRRGIRMAFERRLSIIAGYAGSGKTTSLRGICDVGEQFGRNPILMALSGRAAQRMTESTGRRAMTIAAFLMNLSSKKLKLSKASVIVLDEASMLDLPTLWRILKAIGDASIVLIGDPAQLPPIGFGLTFHPLCEDPDTPKTVLDRVLRQSMDSGIPAVAEAIRHGTPPDLDNFSARRVGVSFVQCEADAAFNEIFEVGIQLRFSGVNRDDVQIIAPVKAGTAGINTINRRFHKLRIEARSLRTRFMHFRDDIAEGDPIIWTKNDFKRGLMNGSLGRLMRVFHNGAEAVIDGQTVLLSPTDGQFLDPAYAISVHKSQGSQWPVVIVPVFRSMILDRNLIYTAITRASEKVVLVGDPLAFASAVKAQPRALCREITLSRRLAHARRSVSQSVL